MRALILALVAACSPRVIDLGHPPIDAPPDTAFAACVCRVPCATTATCASGLGTCSPDGYCSMSTGTCTATTPLPCSTFPSSICTKSATTTTRCGM